MKRPAFLNTLAAAAMLFCYQSASAQSTECQCNCYFSGDCPISGQFCDWDSIPAEDNCWFRSPKPQGNPGAGCTGDHPAWGSCDGICSPPGRNHMVVNESKDNVAEGVRLWHNAFGQAAKNGGGIPSSDWMKRSAAIGFTSDETNDNLWRVVVEIIMITRGPSAMVFPHDDLPSSNTVGIVAMKDGSPEARNIDLAVRAVLAEMNHSGDGRAFVDQMDPAGFDMEFLNQMCGDAPDVMTCLYWRLGGIADVLRQAGRGDGRGGSRGGIVCKGCYADCQPSDAVDINDLLVLLNDWNRTDTPISDLDESGKVDVFDLFLLLGGWGACVPPGPG